jgi:hypothetical protein
LKLRIIVDFCEFLFRNINVFKQIYINNEFTKIRKSIAIGLIESIICIYKKIKDLDTPLPLISLLRKFTTTILPQFIEALENSEPISEPTLSHLVKLDTSLSGLSKLQVSLIKSVKQYTRDLNQYYTTESTHELLQKIVLYILEDSSLPGDRITELIGKEEGFNADLRKCYFRNIEFAN